MTGLPESTGRSAAAGRSGDSAEQELDNGVQRSRCPEHDHERKTYRSQDHPGISRGRSAVRGQEKAGAQRHRRRAGQQRDRGDGRRAGQERGEGQIDENCAILIRTLEKWTEELEIDRLGKYGITSENIEKIVKKAGLKNNPVNLNNKDIETIILNRL